MRPRTRWFWATAAGLAAILAAGAGCRGGAKAPPGKGKTPSPTAAANAPGADSKAKAPAGNTTTGGGGGAGEAAGVSSPAWPFPGQPGKQGAGRDRVQVVSVSRGDRIPGVPPIQVPPVARSPFRAEGLAEAAPTPRPEPGEGRKEPARGGLPPSPVPDWMRPIGLPDGGLPPMETGTGVPLPAPGGVRGSRAVPTPALDTTAPPSPSVQLTGIVWGEPRMAILVDGKGHYIVQEGDPVPGGYTVGSISPHKVVLHAMGSRHIVLFMGGKSG
ncbi:MAG: hypothetical protein HY321_15580 [Armatimonadetes bacterium]|nr:hypothetical protein [Armatimonadota bacterium]